MKNNLEIVKALIKEIKENLQEELKVKGKVVKDYKQNGDKSYAVEYQDGTKETIYVSHDDWDVINDDAKKVDEKKLSAKQKFIAKQAPPKNRINAADFEKLRSMKEDEGQDHEVSMANNSLDSILWAANELKKHLGDQERDIPAWIQDHITNAENFILQAAKNFHDYGDHKEEDFSDIDAADPGYEDTPYDDEINEMSLSSLMEAKKKPSAGLTKKQKSAVAKKARAGKDVGKKGKGFEKVAAKAAKKYGSKERGQKVAAAAMWKNIKRK